MEKIDSEGWSSFLCKERLRKSKIEKRSDSDARSDFENDYHRVVFSSSFRRLKGKAQIFSLEDHDFVRTRLTHSIEVATLGRALGEAVGRKLGIKEREVGSLVATACLLHDIGNPPFGHAGEEAIGEWFKKKTESREKTPFSLNDPQEKADLFKFEGNAQGFRIVTRLQWSGADFGLNLTAATLSLPIKYPVSSDKHLKKFGFLKSDQAAFDRVRGLTGLEGEMRNPFTYLVEAADDIAYLTGDIEDVVKKGLVTYEELVSHLSACEEGGPSASLVKKFLVERYQSFKTSEGALPESERQQMAVQNFAQMTRNLMVQSCIETFVEYADQILKGDYSSDLMTDMNLAELAGNLRNIMEEKVHKHLTILSSEQTCRRVIHGLMDVVFEELAERPEGRISSHIYKSAPSNPSDSNELSEGYKLALRMTDYISGMTDDFALQQFQRSHGMI
jgi:dGTPase